MGCVSSSQKEGSRIEVIDNYSSPIINREKFHFGSIIGEGGFAVIREVRHILDDKWFALKENNLLKVNIEDTEVILNELNGLIRVGVGNSHPYIIHLHLSFRDARSTYMVLDLLTAGDLRIYLGNREIFTERKAAFVIACVGSALNHIHSRKIIHRDLKPENILFDATGYPYVTDFGLSYLSNPKSKYCICDRMSGTAEYFAPEIFVPSTHYHSFESDFWSLGIILYEMLYRKRPCDDPPKHLIRYSRDIHSSTWSTLLKLRDEELATFQDDETVIDPLSTNTQDIKIEQVNLDITYINTIKCINFSDINSSNDIFNHKVTDTMEKEDEENITPSIPPPLSPDLQITIPPINSNKENTTLECFNMLNSLLDVRLTSRIGVGSKFNSFLNHEWFKLQGIKFDQILNKTIPSPITPNLNLVADKICAKLMKTNFEDDNQTLQTDEKRLPSNEINQMIGKFTYLSPEYTSLYYPTNDNDNNFNPNSPKTFIQKSSVIKLVSTRITSVRTVPMDLPPS